MKIAYANTFINSLRGGGMKREEKKEREREKGEERGRKGLNKPL